MKAHAEIIRSRARRLQNSRRLSELYERRFSASDHQRRHSRHAYVDSGALPKRRADGVVLPIGPHSKRRHFHPNDDSRQPIHGWGWGERPGLLQAVSVGRLVSQLALEGNRFQRQSQKTRSTVVYALCISAHLVAFRGPLQRTRIGAGFRDLFAGSRILALIRQSKRFRTLVRLTRISYNQGAHVW